MSLGGILQALGLGLLGLETYKVATADKKKVDALKSYVTAKQAQKEMTNELIELWRNIRDTEQDKQKAIRKFHDLTGIQLKL